MYCYRTEKKIKKKEKKRDKLCIDVTDIEWFQSLWKDGVAMREGNGH